MKNRGKVVALSIAAVAIVVLVAAAILTKDRIREEWYFWQLRRARHSRALAADQPHTDSFGDPVLGMVPPFPPRIDTTVMAVDAKDPLVLLSAGTGQKVEVGYVFIVYRGPEFIGEIKVIRVFQVLCGAEVVFTKDNAEIRRGDKASTRI